MWVGLAAFLSAELGGWADVPGATGVFRHENVMGTSLELRVRTDDPGAARAIEHKVLSEIDRACGPRSGGGVSRR
jgi:hypothetical protein